jgi:hypothetical protein
MGWWLLQHFRRGLSCMHDVNLRGFLAPVASRFLIDAKSISDDFRTLPLIDFYRVKNLKSRLRVRDSANAELTGTLQACLRHIVVERLVMARHWGRQQG